MTGTRRLIDTADYNRGLAWPVRILHALANSTTWPLWLAAILFVVLFPFDAQLSAWISSWPIRGDVAQELKAWQQYGAIGSLVFTALLIWRLDPDRLRRTLDLIAAVVLTGVVVTSMKMLLGRPRPIWDDPERFVPPWAMYPVLEDGTPVLTYAWQGEDQLWSMPSSHTAYAVVLTVILVFLYPRLKWIGIALAILVGFSRVHFGKHYPSDVAVGACIAAWLAIPAIRHYWGVRALDWIWLRFIDRNATPSYPGILDRPPT